MKKILLMFSAVALTTLSYAQRPTHYIVDYNGANHVVGATDCVSGVPSGNGGIAYGGGNVASVTYTSPGSSELLFTASSTTIDPTITPYYFNVYQLDNLTSNCVTMGSVDSSINISASGKVKVTAKSSVAGTKFIFYVGYHTTGWPGTGTYNYSSLQDTITLTTSFATYTVNWLGIPEWTNASVGANKVNLWGIRMMALNNNISINKIEFGSTTVTSIAKPTLTNAISVYPNPSAGKVTLNTHNRAGNVYITNPLGAVVETISVSSAKDSYEVSLNTKGLYFLNFVTEEGSAIEKLVIE